LGSVFFGAVHDFAALYTSVRNKGKSVGYVIELYVGKTGKWLFLLFVWLFSILIAGAFADIAAGTFAGIGAGGEEIRTNAQVAGASALFVAAAAGLGFLIHRRKTSGLASGVIAVDLLIVCIALGLFFPIFLPKGIWLYLVFGYIFTASVVPVWALGQPRNYLNSFLLIAMILAAFIGIVFTRPVIAIPAFTGFEVEGNYLFPSLFITIACGAISGFHSLVAAGAVSRQLDNERYMLPVSYGAMLVETLVAVLALISVGSLARGGILPGETPPVIFAAAVSGFLHQLGLPSGVSFSIVSLAVSSFVLTTLDTVARLGRLSFQELFAPEETGGGGRSVGQGSVRRVFSSLRRFLGGKAAAAFCTLLPAYLLAILGYQNIWALFGAANQLLAALTLLACALFLKRSSRRVGMLALPTAIMLGVTYSSLVLTIVQKAGRLFSGGFRAGADGLQLVLALALLILGVLVGFSCTVKLFAKGRPAGGLD
jgi:carbon starvation protein